MGKTLILTKKRPVSKPKDFPPKRNPANSISSYRGKIASNKPLSYKKKS